MVSDNTDRNVLFIAFTVLTVCNLTHMVTDSLDSVNVKDRLDILHHSSKSFKSHTSVNIFLFKWCICSVLVTFKLCEHEIPEFHISIAITAYCTIRLSTTVLFSTVEINL